MLLLTGAAWDNGGCPVRVRALPSPPNSFSFPTSFFFSIFPVRFFSLFSSQKGMEKARIITVKRSLTFYIRHQSSMLAGFKESLGDGRTTAGLQTSSNSCLNEYISATRQPHANLKVVLLLHYEDTCSNFVTISQNELIVNYLLALTYMFL